MLPSFPHSSFTKSHPDHKDGVFLLETNLKEGKHEEVYIRIREKEGHLLSDPQVLALPDQAPSTEFDRFAMGDKEAKCSCRQ